MLSKYTKFGFNKFNNYQNGGAFSNGDDLLERTFYGQKNYLNRNEDKTHFDTIENQFFDNQTYQHISRDISRLRKRFVKNAKTFKIYQSTKSIKNGFLSFTINKWIKMNFYFVSTLAFNLIDEILFF